MCRVEGCEVKEKSGGFCSRHLYRFYRYGDPLGRPASKARPCAVVGCTGVARFRGWCSAHYYRWRRTGEVGSPEIRDPHRSIEDRIAEKLASPDENGCVLWRGHCDGNGYGVISHHSRNRRVNRILFEIELGRSLLRTEWVCHHCDNPPCCTRGHLYLGNKATNAADVVTRGRAGRDGNAKLAPDDVREIRRLLATGQKRSVIATQYGVHYATIWEIDRGISWTNIP